MVYKFHCFFLYHISFHIPNCRSKKIQIDSCIKHLKYYLIKIIPFQIILLSLLILKTRTDYPQGCENSATPCIQIVVLDHYRFSRFSFLVENKLLFPRWGWKYNKSKKIKQLKNILTNADDVVWSILPQTIKNKEIL